jgi:uncharacterized protein (TIGR03083 family)
LDDEMLDWNTLLSGATTDLARLAAEVDLTAAVPACPEWCVADLVEHVGGVHQWARHAIVEQNPEGTPEPAPSDLSSLPAWYAGHAGDLLETVTEREPTDPAWTFGRRVGTVGWWARRQTHETLMHTRDVLAAAERTHEWAIDPVVAWDGVLEVEETFYLRQVRLARMEPLPATLLLRATDVDADPLRLGDGAPLVEIAAPAEELLLLLWHRTTSTDPVAAELLAHPITP